MNDLFERLTPLFTDEERANWQKARIAIIGLGGVGGAAAELVARSGVGSIVLVDFDVVHPSNLNRQIISNVENIGQKKTSLFDERLRMINPNVEIIVYDVRLQISNINKILNNVDFVIDAIDDLENKAELISYCLKQEIPFISAMGMALKTDPSLIKVMKMNQTSYDPLAKALRGKLRQLNIPLNFIVVSSTEVPRPLKDGILGSYMAVTFTAGLVAGDYALKILSQKR